MSTTGIGAVDKLLSRRGLESMMSTVALILCALSFGGIMERAGMLRRLAEAIMSGARRTGSLGYTHYRDYMQHGIILNVATQQYF